MVDNFYAKVHTRIRRVILNQIKTPRWAKDRSQQRNIIRTETVLLNSTNQINQKVEWADWEELINSQSGTVRAKGNEKSRLDREGVKASEGRWGGSEWSKNIV